MAEANVFPGPHLLEAVPRASYLSPIQFVDQSDHSLPSHPSARLPGRGYAVAVKTSALIIPGHCSIKLALGISTDDLQCGQSYQTPHHCCWLDCATTLGCKAPCVVDTGQVMFSSVTSFPFFRLPGRGGELCGGDCLTKMDNPNRNTQSQPTINSRWGLCRTRPSILRWRHRR